jgi:xanthine dehydrogenase accessory factor
VRLPCGGRLDVLVEQITPNPDTIRHFLTISDALTGGHELMRTVRLADGRRWLEKAEFGGPKVLRKEVEEIVQIRIGAVAKLILAGYSTVAEACADFAISLGYHVVLCDPRGEVTAGIDLQKDIEFIPQLPSLYIASEGACTVSTAIVAVTHDPRIDDLAMMAAVKTTAGYIGVMGSMKTSQVRAERLKRAGGLSQEQIQRIHMPIGLDLGSKTPAEIALAIMADVVRVRRGKSLNTPPEPAFI